MITKHYLTAVQRAGAGPCGAFSVTVGEQSPWILALIQHASLAEMEKTTAKMGADPEFIKARDGFYGSGGPPYIRSEVQLLRAFAGFPKIEVPATSADRPARVFELRTYESNTPLSLAKKIKMFEDGEIDIFRKTGLQPVFFGRTIAGWRMPNLTYLLAYDNLAAREANWRTFVTSPEWKKLSATPGLSDAEVVSNISNWLLSPLPGSPIR
jgi:hypothetical protein